MAPVRADRRSTAHLYLILGEEDLRADDALRTLLDELIPEGERALNLDVIDAGEAPVQDIITRCDTLPFFGARRVVVLRRAQALKPPDQDALAAYLEQGPPPSVLVVVAERLDKRRRFHAVLQKSGRVIVCDPLRPGDLPGWVRTRVAREGKKITPDAAELLITVVGGHLRELSLEIGKLAAYTGGRDTITAEDVREVASHVAEATVFELMDAVGRRQAGRALALLDYGRLGAKATWPASALTLSERKRLEMVRALATGPDLLLLDEVLAGLNAQEIQEMTAIVRRLSREFGLAILLIEHNVRAVMTLSDQVVVLNYGTVIARGEPAAVVRNSGVIAAYLGDRRAPAETRADHA